MAFTVFPKKGLEPFAIKIERFEVSGNDFILFDSGNSPSKEAFLSFDDVAAILPKGKQPATEGLMPFDV